MEGREEVESEREHAGKWPVTSKSPVVRIWKATQNVRMEPFLHCPRLLTGDWHNTIDNLLFCRWAEQQEKTKEAPEGKTWKVCGRNASHILFKHPNAT